ncbi:MAG: ImmA/IrrE family metallo-endopeptidase [Gammaproteobacteria bacterium]|nr:ImmA/IrrE family metallo-endopeptidase [Gammaproteobacteria bacterium]
MYRPSIKPELLRWARERAGLQIEDLAGKFKKPPEWESGKVRPTFKQAEDFARKVHLPFGYLFLPEPPEETIPIEDFRTFKGKSIKRPSPNLLDTIYICQRRQHWYQDYALTNGMPELDFAASVTVDIPPEIVVASMRKTLSFDLDTRRKCASWEEALRLLIQSIDETGILVMVSGIVKSNRHRTLDPNEFSGFTLYDSLAPLIFVNSMDLRNMQMFTLAHELAHIWLGFSGLSNYKDTLTSQNQEETWCKKVAAEFLVPLDKLQVDLRNDELLSDSLSLLASQCKVSKPLVLRCLYDAGLLTKKRFDKTWRKEIISCIEQSKSGAWGGNFYRTTLTRVGRRFVYALVASTLEGKTLYRDAFGMLGINKSRTFNRLGKEAGLLVEQNISLT